MANESALVTRIAKEYRKRKAKVIKIHGSAMQPKEIDLVVCYHGYFIGLEVKDPTATRGATPLQQHTISEIVRAGGTASVVRSLDEALELLAHIDQKLAGTQLRL